MLRDATAHRKTQLFPIEVLWEFVEQPWLSSLLCVLVEGIPANAHHHFIDLRRLANAGPAAVNACDCLCQHSLHRAVGLYHHHDADDAAPVTRTHTVPDLNWPSSRSLIQFAHDAKIVIKKVTSYWLPTCRAELSKLAVGIPSSLEPLPKPFTTVPTSRHGGCMGVTQPQMRSSNGGSPYRDGWKSSREESTSQQPAKHYSHQCHQDVCYPYEMLDLCLIFEADMGLRKGYAMLPAKPRTDWTVINVMIHSYLQIQFPVEYLNKSGPDDNLMWACQCCSPTASKG